MVKYLLAVLLVYLLLGLWSSYVIRINCKEVLDDEQSIKFIQDYPESASLITAVVGPLVIVGSVLMSLYDLLKVNKKGK